MYRHTEGLFISIIWGKNLSPRDHSKTWQISRFSRKLTVAVLVVVALHGESNPSKAQMNDIGTTSRSDLLTNTIGMEFVNIPAGSFVMGSYEAGWVEQPHDVTLTHSFFLGVHEVTQAEWRLVMDANPSDFKGDDRPVERVSWLDVQSFIDRLNDLEPDKTYRLPTEAEWEYAARAGTTKRYTETDNLTELCRFANISDISGSVDTTRVPVDCDDGYVRTAPVGQFSPNAWGLYDMTGNVWEWTNDWFDAAYYARSPVINPKGPVTGSKRVLRGGGWGLRPHMYRLSYRMGVEPDYISHAAGFRLVCQVKRDDDR